MSAAALDANNSNNGCVVGLNVAAADVGGAVSDDVEVVGGEEGCQIAALDMEMKIEVKSVVIEEKSGVKKRGRPARAQTRAQPKATQPRAQPKAQAKVVDDEEDVCFICFDGGNLVLCDRRGCPKAYHPACIKRDEAFFQSKSKWNCGWHLCSNCEKASHYMCYTCTYSLCKSCIKDADILCVRGNKGFCPLCMKTIMLIENSEQGNKDSIQVDFDDKSSWEYLFKVYWVYLKTKLSLTFEELAKSKNPGKGATSTMKIKSPEKLFGRNDDKDYSSDSFSDYQEGEDHRKKKAKKLAKLPNKEDPGNMAKPYNEKLLSVPIGEDWASKELLEFVSHVKNGDVSVLSQFDVQALLLEYVKTNNLRDPRRKSQIICDSRLLKMFGKARVGHFEMLKLLELHFLNQEESQVNNLVQGGFIGAGATQVEVDGAVDKQMILGRDKKRKTHKIGVAKGPHTNLDEYAAIDVHNISLIYLRRSLLESLVDDIEKFQGKIVGAVVRIRISSSDQSQDYRLVRVIGTSKVAIPYKVGERTLDVMLEILNLDKKEVVCIDEISNQDFSKDECIRFRQSMKCGIVERFTVGNILKKALALQAVRVNDGLEAEISRLNHLRDRANEKGHSKDLRECVEKLQLLNTVEERQRRELEVLEVNADPHMDPSYESDDHGELGHKKPDENLEPRSSNISKRMKPLTKYGTCEPIKSINGRQNMATSSEPNRIMSATVYPDKESATRISERENGSLVNPQNDVYRSNTIEAWDNRADVRYEPSTTDKFDISEIGKVWNYRDPSGTIQGPFSMLQLRKWCKSGYFPPDLRIWRSNDEQSDTLFLTDAMNGHTHKELQMKHTNSELTTNSTVNAEVNPPDINSGVTQAERSSQGYVLIEGKESESTLSDKPNLLIPPTYPGKVSATVSHISGEEEDRRFSESESGQSHKQGLKPQPSPVDSSTNTWDIAFTLVSITKSLELSEQNHEVDFPNLPSPTPKPNNETGNKHSVPSNHHIQDSDPNWSNNAPILVGNEAQIPVTANEWGGYSPTPIKPSNDVWDLDLNLVSGPVSEPSKMNRGNIASDLNAKIEELFRSSPSNPVSTTTDWQTLVTGASEFPLADEWFPEESVSDLLAEVDAMESLNKGPLSPTSAMNCTVEGLSPTSYTGKSDAMSCSSNILMPCQSTKGSNAPYQKRSGGESFTNDEAEGETQPPDSSSASWEMPGGADSEWRGGPEIIETGQEQVHRNPALNWGGPVQININMGWGNGQGNPPQANANINWVNPHGNLGPWPIQQPQYIGGERFSGQRVDRNSFPGGGGSSYGRDSRPSRNNRAAPSFGGGGSSFRPSPKGRICKFFESGHCRKGLKCDYLHP